MKKRPFRTSAAIVIWFAALLACAPTGGADWATVKRTTDGDTVLLSDGRKVRYIGIDAPEIDHKQGRAEAFGREARRANQRLVADRKIRLETDTEAKDRYGRVLAYVYLPDGTMVNAELVRLGLAVVLYKRPNISGFSDLLNVQRQAMKAGRGIWQTLDTGGPAVMGNRNSRRFHLTSCPSARKIRPGNRVPFKKKWDAYWDGYSPARGCIPKTYQ